MKWIYSIRNKMTAGLLLFIVLVAGLLLNWGERHNSSSVQKAVDSIYRDRLLAESYIFQYLQNSQQIVDIIDDPRFTPEIKKAYLLPVVKRVDDLNASYSETKLTRAESFDFNRLTNLYHAIETGINQGRLTYARDLSKETMQVLEGLSGIQVAEAGNQIATIRNIDLSTSFYYYMEIAVFVLVGIMIQALIFTSGRWQADRLNQKSWLN